MTGWPTLPPPRVWGSGREATINLARAVWGALAAAILAVVAIIFGYYW